MDGPDHQPGSPILPVETVGSHRRAARKQGDDPCEQAFKEDYRAALYLRLIQSPHVYFKWHLRHKVLTLWPCVVWTRKKKEGLRVSQRNASLRTRTQARAALWKGPLCSGSGKSSSARAAPPPVLEVSCFNKTLRCAGPEAAEGSREPEIEVSAWTV